MLCIPIMRIMAEVLLVDKFNYGSLQGLSQFSSLVSFYSEIFHPLFSGGFPSFYSPFHYISTLHLYVLGHFLGYLSHQDSSRGGRMSC